MQVFKENLIEAERSASLYERMGPAIEVSGGAAANSMGKNRSANLTSDKRMVAFR